VPAPEDPSGSYVYDNVFVGTYPYFSATQTSGITFDFGAGDEANLYFQPNDSIFYFGLLEAVGAGENPGYVENVKVTSDISATPIPGALPLFAGGLVLFGWLVSRRRKYTTFLAAA
jgi:uncharacterized protein (TIGR03382 family)